MITGTYPSQHGAWSLGTKLPEDVHVVGDDFRAAGYRTCLIGKAHFQQVKSTAEYQHKCDGVARPRQYYGSTGSAFHHVMLTAQCQLPPSDFLPDAPQYPPETWDHVPLYQPNRLLACAASFDIKDNCTC